MAVHIESSSKAIMHKPAARIDSGASALRALSAVKDSVASARASELLGRSVPTQEVTFSANQSVE